MAARVIAEASNPRADVVAGVAEEHLVVLRDQGLLRQPSVPAEIEYFPEAFSHEHGYWYSYFNTVLGIVVNTEVFQQKWPDREIPRTWDDFLAPEYAGEIVMPNPVLSGTAYTFVLSNLLRYEDMEDGWAYLEAFADQIGLMTASGVAPSRMVAIGEFPFGVTFAHDAARNIRAGFLMEFIVPGKTASSTGNISAVKNGPNGDEAADHFINWYLGVDAQQLHTDLRLEASMNSQVFLPSGLPQFEDLDLVTIDSEWAAQNRAEILERWETFVD
jgi:iron(III) transport system substrate-binding protein